MLLTADVKSIYHCEFYNVCTAYSFAFEVSRMGGQLLFIMYAFHFCVKMSFGGNNLLVVLFCIVVTQFQRKLLINVVTFLLNR